MIQDTFMTLADGSCLAICLSKMVNPDLLDSQHMANVILGWRKSYIDDDGYVNNPCMYLNLIDPENRDWSYDIVNITSLDEIPKDTLVAVLYSINGKDGHFVLVKNGKVVFNSLDNSKNFREGKPISYRLIKHTN